MKIIFEHAIDETEDVKTFWFKPEQLPRYTAGQFVELTIRHEHPDNRGEKRWFTLSSPPNDARGISITTRYAGDDKTSSFKRKLFSLQPGDSVTMSQPLGDFVLPKGPNTPLIFIAGGIGITPFHSILASLGPIDGHRNIHFLYSVRTEEDILFQDTMARAGVHATIFVQEPTNAWGGERGRLTAEQIIALTNLLPTSLLYLSGPEPMVESLTKNLRDAGMPNWQLITDFFPGYTDQ